MAPKPGASAEVATTSDQLPKGQTLLNSLVGQAAAGITLAAALVYGAGALTVALRLDFTHLQWESVLGQIPRDLIITNGFGQVVLPAAIIGMLGAILLNFLVNEKHDSGHGRGVVRLQKALQGYLLAKPRLSHFVRWFMVALLLGLAEAAIAVPWYLIQRNQFPRGVLISVSSYLLTVVALSAVAVGISLIFLPAPRQGSVVLASASQGERHTSGEAAHEGDGSRKTASTLSAWEWKALVGALVAFGSIPGIAAFSASTTFPQATLCSPIFKYDQQLSGDLIATNGGWAYMVEYKIGDYSHDHISVVPLSAVRLVAIGRFGTCRPLATTSGQAARNP